jgi:integrase
VADDRKNIVLTVIFPSPSNVHRTSCRAAPLKPRCRFGVGFRTRCAARLPAAPAIPAAPFWAAFLEAAPSLKYKAALSVAYGAGLRVSEVAALKICDIDSERMLIRVEQGKGRKDRNAMLSPVLLELLREWWKVCRSRGWLFPGRDPGQPITTRQAIPWPRLPKLYQQTPVLYRPGDRARTPSRTPTTPSS